MELTQEYVRHLLDYKDGQLFWKHPKQGRQLSRPVGCNRTGYLTAMIDGKLYQLHRIVFLYHHGYMPNAIDHKDTNRANNRIENLRPATMLQNSFNRGKNKNNTSGFKGVTWESRRLKWVAQIVLNGRHKCLGQYDTPEDAHAAYVAAATKHIGEFARAA